MASGLIDVVQQGAIAVVTLTRPRANAMNLELTEEIAAVFQRLGQGGSVRSVVLTGQGKSFCAGVDLKAVPDFDEARQRRMDTPFLADLTEVRVGMRYPVAAMQVARQELRPDVARRLVLFGQNITATAAVAAGVFDETVDPEALLATALARATSSPLCHH